MAINPGDLEATAAAYEQAAKKLREAAEILRNGPVATSPSSNGMTRLDQLKQWLREHGPAPRSMILERIDMPHGTVASLLTKKNFNQDNEGRWKMKEEES